MTPLSLATVDTREPMSASKLLGTVSAAASSLLHSPLPPPRLQQQQGLVYSAGGGLGAALEPRGVLRLLPRWRGGGAWCPSQGPGEAAIGGGALGTRQLCAISHGLSRVAFWRGDGG